MIFFCPLRLHDLFSSREVAWFLLSQDVAGFFVLKRLRDIFVPRGCVIFCCPERLRDFFCPEGVVDFFSPERLGEFFWSKEVRFAISEIR